MDKLEEGVIIDHRKDWEVGNHEDGLLKGVENLISCWTTVLQLIGGSLLRVRGFTGVSEGGKSDDSPPEMMPLTRTVTATPENLRWGFCENQMQSLKQELEDNSIDTTLWGVEGAKTIEELYSEIHEENVVTFERKEDGRYVRVMEVVKAWILADLGKEAPFTLMEPKKHLRGSEDPNWKSPDRVQGKPLQRKVRIGGHWMEALLDALCERLSLEAAQVEQIFEIKSSSYKKKDDTRKGTREDGYINMWSTYRVHEVDLQVKNPRDASLIEFGLPDGKDFTTMSKGIHSAFGYRSHSWKWFPLNSTAYKPREGDASQKLSFSDLCAKKMSQPDRTKAGSADHESGPYPAQPLTSVV
jgi:hypothetical protein